LSKVAFVPHYERRVLTSLDPPKFDLESYIANYAGIAISLQCLWRSASDTFKGFTRIDRLHHIGSHSPYLALDAYRLATAEAKKGKNVNLYLQLVEELSGIAPQDPAALVDTTWAEKRAQETQREQDRLEHELKSYKNNLIKESIRVWLRRNSYARVL
jgi:COP9 signalosome complex subunit 1